MRLDRGWTATDSFDASGREWTNHRRVLPVSPFRRSRSRTRHFRPFDDGLALPRLADSRFPSRTCETHALLPSRTIVSRTRAATPRLSTSLRCITTECRKFAVRLHRGRIIIQGTDRRPRKNSLPARLNVRAPMPLGKKNSLQARCILQCWITDAISR